MLAKRVFTALLLAAIGIPAVLAGGDIFLVLIGLLLLVAAWEYVHIFRKASFQPSEGVLLVGVLLLLWVRTRASAYEALTLSAIFLLAMTFHLFAYERGRDKAATDFAVTLGGILYLGWIGAYLVLLRDLPNGVWWFFLALPVVWLADTGAYFIGKRFGKHKLSPRLSPKKTWEGYLAGIVVGTLSGILFAALWQRFGGLSLSLEGGAWIGLILSVVTTLGDLGESMLKRQAGVKDSGRIFPGHGGVLDRMDTWLWASTIGYYLIFYFFQ
jgi:phosphatidate cytidylyltransferase